MADHLQWFGDCGAVSPHTVSEVDFPVGSTEECVFCEDDDCVSTVRLKVCGDLFAFADDELDEASAVAFRGHLPNCAACQDGVAEAIQFGERLRSLMARR